jgi:SpoVK/Ycf46/Vps4 family AAA+-type ATPase
MTAATATAKEFDTERITTIFKHGPTYTLHGDVGMVEVLPAKILEVKLNPLSGFYLEEGNKITLPKKIYSNDKVFIDHVLKSYSSAQASVGILLSGKKGLGKSFTANVICDTLKLPVIKITQNFPEGADMLGFLNRIRQEHIIFIDEFEKIFTNRGYDPDEDNSGDAGGMMTQTSFLSFLDSGSLSVKRLFIITTNSSISDFMMNRPSRIRYHRKYEKMNIETIKEIVNENIDKEEYKDDLIENIPQRYVNIDVLIKIVEEVNLHDKPYSTFKDFFNFSVDDDERYTLIDEEGNIMEEQVYVPTPLKKGHRLAYSEAHRDYIHYEQTTSAEKGHIEIVGRTNNPNWNGKNPAKRFLFANYTLETEYKRLFDF